MQIADKLSIVGKMAATLAKSNEIILALSFGVSIFCFLLAQTCMQVEAFYILVLFLSLPRLVSAN